MELPMRIHIGYQLRFAIPAPTPMIFLLHALPNRYTFLQPEHLTLSPHTPFQLFTDHYGNLSTRLLAQPGSLTITNDAIVQSDGQPDPANPTAAQLPVCDLPTETLHFLPASRYCQTDLLMEFAWQRFGHGPTGYQRVQALCSYVHNHIQFGYAFANPTKSAFDVWLSRQGVCRDFAHLAITLCRCLGIPARYATGYLGDIGIPPDPAPMDFSAWFEAFLDGTWYTFDARHNTPRIGRIIMAYGRDASDAALTTSFGPTTLQQFQVSAQQI